MRNRLSRTAMLVRTAILPAGALLLSGCASSGALTLECAPFRTHFAQPVSDNSIVEAIRSDSAVPSAAIFAPAELDRIIDTSAMGRSIETQARRVLTAKATAGVKGTDAKTDAGPVYLLLSGGGQWGAYGAGFLEALANGNPSQLPGPRVVTGVSTGGLQALFVGAHAAEPEKRWLTELRRQYSPASEADVVKRGSWLGAVFKGSVARLGPLRARIEAALCPKAGGRPAADPLTLADCPLIEALASDRAPEVMLGFVEAGSGQLLFVSANEIARGTYPVAGPDGVRSVTMPVRERQQCLTGAAMASAAVPVQYQQLRISSIEPVVGPRPRGVTDRSSAKTYMDGGVRQSVFFALPQALFERAMVRAGADAGADYSGMAYVVRNGPTEARADVAPDAKADAFTAAMRGYALMVNQSEVSSIAALRLIWPTTPLYVTTADGYGTTFVDPAPEPGFAAEWKTCRSDMNLSGGAPRSGAMFNPDFMACLRAFGRFKASRPFPAPQPPDSRQPDRWIELPTIAVRGRDSGN